MDVHRGTHKMEALLFLLVPCKTLTQGTFKQQTREKVCEGLRLDCLWKRPKNCLGSRCAHNPRLFASGIGHDSQSQSMTTEKIEDI